MKAYPSWFLPLLLTTITVLIVSGLLLIPTTLEMRFMQNMSWRLSGSLRLMDVATHTSVSYLMMMLIGALAMIHMRAGWRKQHNHISGVLLLTVFLILLLSGLGLLYFGEESWILTASVAHIAAGVGIIGFAAVHIVKGRLRYRQKSVNFAENPDFKAVNN